MRRETIYRIAIIFLLVTNVATVLTVRKVVVEREEENIPVAQMPRESRVDYFRGTLGFNQEQEEAFELYNAEYNRRASGINRDLLMQRRMMINELASDKPAEERLDSILDAFGEGQVELKRATIEYYNHLRSICSEDQLENLEIFFRDMLDPQGSIYMYGRGRNGQGRGMGRACRGRRGP
ncbi:MAG: hypothetical protein R2744_09910 [Bacteroidales bacterium]